MYKNVASNPNAKGSNVTKIFSYFVLCGIAAIVVVAILGWSRQFSSTNASGFVSEATIGNEFEIESSRLALTKSQNDALKQFAQHMIDDHTKAAQGLSAALSSVPDITAESASTRLDQKHQAMLDKLNGANGQDFDRLYVKDQMKAHDSAVGLFKDYANSGDNQTLKDFAARTLPTLESHQHDIEQINSTFFRR